MTRIKLQRRGRARKRHGVTVAGSDPVQSRSGRFTEYGDSEAWRTQAEALRKDYGDLDARDTAGTGRGK